MPLYEFVCIACGRTFEEICARDAAAPPCPACGAAGGEKQISVPGPRITNAFPYPPTGRVHSLGRPGAMPSCGHCSGQSDCN